MIFWDGGCQIELAADWYVRALPFADAENSLCTKYEMRDAVYPMPYHDKVHNPVLSSPRPQTNLGVKEHPTSMTLTREYCTC